MGMTNFEFFAIVVFVMAVLGLAAWREIKAKRDEALARKERYEEKRRRVEKAQKIAEEDMRLAKLYAADHYNEACNMEPFCGEGKKLTENEKREELARLNLYPLANVPDHLRPDPYKTSYEPQYWQTLFGEGRKP